MLTPREPSALYPHRKAAAEEPHGAGGLGGAALLFLLPVGLLAAEIALVWQAFASVDVSHEAADLVRETVICLNFWLVIVGLWRASDRQEVGR